ncbi:hypothetical protein PM082_021218 [Marasmius tenuissimus]|nr:hypothetical protein PM082_021218 [Marasmius tenuissimus]
MTWHGDGVTVWLLDTCYSACHPLTRFSSYVISIYSYLCLCLLSISISALRLPGPSHISGNQYNSEFEFMRSQSILEASTQSICKQSSLYFGVWEIKILYNLKARTRGNLYPKKLNFSGLFRVSSGVHILLGLSAYSYLCAIALTTKLFHARTNSQFPDFRDLENLTCTSNLMEGNQNMDPRCVLSIPVQTTQHILKVSGPDFRQRQVSY